MSGFAVWDGCPSGGRAACRNGDTLVVAKLDRPARSLRDAKDIVDELAVKGVKLSIGGSVHDPTDPIRPSGNNEPFNRLVYRVIENDLVILQTRFHYDD